MWETTRVSPPTTREAHKLLQPFPSEVCTAQIYHVHILYNKYSNWVHKYNTQINIYHLVGTDSFPVQ